LPAKPRVTLVFTQVDRYQTDDDFLHSFTPAELDLIGHDHPDVDWMMVSVLVPPDSEFGIDAFVRRVTGLGEFGVPDGRPRSRAASSGALARLAVQRKLSRESRPDDGAARAATSAAPPAEQAATSAAPPRTSHSFLWLILITVVVFALAHLAVLYFRSARVLPRAATSAAPPAEALPRERSRLSRPDAEVAATNTTPGACVQAALSNETAVALAKARACSKLQEAREILTYAAESLDSAEALYERARVDDFLGWGAFVRTRDEKVRNPPWTEWLRRIDLLGEKKAVVMMYPSTSNNAHIVYRTQALKGYREAAARGVSAAVDALARHANHENDKDVRRSSATTAEGK